MKKNLIRLAKLMVSVALVWVIWRYFLKINDWQSIWIEIKNTPVFIFVAAIIISFINWGLEAKKWQILVRNLEKINYFTAWKSTCAGAAISNILPFRIGEYLGRILFISEENRIPAIFNSVFGSTMQLGVSLVFGIPASLYILEGSLQKISTYALLALAGIIAVFALIFFISGRIKSVRKKWLNKVLDDIRKFTPKQIFQGLMIAFGRYILFSSFYVFLLYQFGISSSVLFLYAGVASIYLIQSFAPSMLLTDAGLRTGIPLLVLKVSVALQPALLAAALINYFFNVLFPAIIGLYYIIVSKIKGIE